MSYVSELRGVPFFSCLREVVPLDFLVVNRNPNFDQGVASRTCKTDRGKKQQQSVTTAGDSYGSCCGPTHKVDII